MNRQMLTKEQVAELLNITPRQVQRMICERRIPFTKIGDGRSAPVRFDPVAIDRWLAARSTPVAS